MIENSEIRKLSDADLKERIDLEQKSLAKIRFNHTVAGLESPKVIVYKKRGIARLLTELNSRKKANA